MKKVFVMMTLFALAGSVVFAQLPTQSLAMAAVPSSTTSEEFADVEGIPLSADETVQVKGGDLILSINRNKQTMKVISGSPLAIVNDKAEVYTVPVTTRVVTNAQARAGQDRDAMEGSSFVGFGKDAYLPIQLSAGSYSLDYVSKNVGGYGPGIHIDASVLTTMLAGSPRNMNDYFVHATDKDNTWGCIGVKGKGNMSRVLESYERAYGPKILTISAYSSRDRD
jgi:hypothetical protein